ncbi:packaged DNA stabilization protein [Legionella maceachernii]|uniref:Phage stabilization protein n=1 Tax=Legionella maceachernii TaxID=466 RepID=A0A0W0WBI9_9GAMM|nr:packaged DNA stabilization protein [Legionella maceachernii]KTD29672.1 Phage stabilization protein [Legionella maceachernii]SKA20993.1 Phage stabilisation protein [Legionella maceachernii]SUP02604.1 Phage stabilisation protein [Legionella maceachernii]
MVMTPGATQIPVRIVGSSIFGRHPIISDERTWNMFISDDWLLNFAGYEQAVEILTQGTEGRGLFHSTRGNFLLAVLGANVYRIDANLGFSFLFSIATNTGEVFMDENLSSQIAIVDGSTIAYIYNYTTETFGNIVWDYGSGGTTFTPNYVTYQNTYFIFGNGDNTTSGSQWFVYKSGFNPTTLADPLKLSWVQTLTLQTKPDFAKACIRIPSHGNNLLVLGSTVAEIWTNVAGLQIYQRQSSINIDYGVASVSTIAASDDMIAWLGINEKSSPAIMVMTGGQAQRISTDGIDYLLSGVERPDRSTAMFYRQDGHVFYILTFFDQADNFSIMYDFTTQKFFDITDWDFTYHPARQMAYFDNEIYFVSLKQGSLMRISTNLTSISTDIQNEYEIPRIRKCDTYRLPGSDRFIVNQFSFTIENGIEPDVDYQFECDGHILGEVSGNFMYSEDDLPLLVEGGSCQIYRPRVDVTLSKNGGETYSNAVSYYMHPTGKYKNQPRFNKLGEANQFTIQMRFWGFGGVVVANGMLEVYQ